MALLGPLNTEKALLEDLASWPERLELRQPLHCGSAVAIVTRPSQGAFQVTDIAGKQRSSLVSIFTVSIGFILRFKKTIVTL